MISELKQRARHLKTGAYARYLAARHPATLWYAMLLVAAIAAYAISSNDLIPDFVPLLGYLDVLRLVPLGAGFVIVVIWLSLAVLGILSAHQAPH